MYEADPFAARKAVDERQEKAARKKEEASRPETASREVKQSSEFAHAPEAKMATALRDFVERAIKQVRSPPGSRLHEAFHVSYLGIHQVIEMYPEAEDSEPAHLASEDHLPIMKDLERLGFSATQARTALTALSRPSPLTTSLLGRLPPLQACIEFLILQVPECDLPQRFLPTVNSSNPFVTSAHAGTDNLQKRWIEDKAVKECGWPAHIVKDCMSEPELAEDWGKLLFALDCRLVGLDWREASMQFSNLEVIDEDEVEAFGGTRGLNGELVIPLPVAPLSLHIIVSEDRTVPTSDIHLPMYLTSPSVAAYVRLHIISKVIDAFSSGTLREPGESVIMAMVRLIEEEWVVIQDNGSPNLADVLRYLMPTTQPHATPDAGPARSTSVLTVPSTERTRAPRHDDRSDKTVRDEFEQLTRRSEYTIMTQSRQKLPAFAARDQLLSMLKSHRCVVVVGETGKLPIRVPLRPRCRSWCFQQAAERQRSVRPPSRQSCSRILTYIECSATVRIG